MSFNPILPSVLVADDEVSVRNFLEEILSEDYEVVTAEDGAKALEIVEKREFDLVLLDIHMPKVSGLEIVETLSTKYPDTVVILLTAHGTMEIAIESLRHNVYDFLQKPCKIADLRKSIQGGFLERSQRLQLRDGHRLISVGAHELRSAAAGVNLSADMLQMIGERNYPQYLGTLVEQARRLARIASDILDLNTLKENNHQPFTSVDVNAYLLEVLPSYTLQGAAKKIKVIAHLEPNLPPISGNSLQIHFALSNILSNAINYTAEGQITVSTYLDVDKQQITITVQDTGMGIEASDIPHLLERFYRGKTVSQSNFSGSGLGLAIVKDVLETHQGEIDIHSIPGQGSTFTLRFPINHHIPATNLPHNPYSPAAFSR